jgi:exosortase
VTQPSASAFARASRAKALQLFFLLAISLVLWKQPLTSTLNLALVSDAHTHILLIVPVSLALIFVRTREAIATAAVERWAGAILLSVPLLLRACTAWNITRLSPSNALSLNMFALVIWWIGSVVVCYGVPTFWTLLFPLCFLLLVVPFPDRILDWITQTLQYQSAVASEWLFRAFRIPVTRDGVFLSIPGLEIEVARECSSIRSSTMLIIIALVLTNLFLHTRWRQILLVAVALPLSVVKNAVRIFTIAVLSTHVDPAYMTGRLHRHGGIIFLAAAVLVVIALLWILRRGEIRGAQMSGNAELLPERQRSFSTSDR